MLAENRILLASVSTKLQLSYVSTVQHTSRCQPVLARIVPRPSGACRPSGDSDQSSASRCLSGNGVNSGIRSTLWNSSRLTAQYYCRSSPLSDTNAGINTSFSSLSANAAARHDLHIYPLGTTPSSTARQPTTTPVAVNATHPAAHTGTHTLPASSCYSRRDPATASHPWSTAARFTTSPPTGSGLSHPTYPLK